MGQANQGVNAFHHRYHAIPRVLIFLRNGEDVLLMKGAPTKRLWANLYNGVGGHVEQDEDVLSAARREVREETGLEANDLHLCAVVNIDAGDERMGILMFIFTGGSATRATTASAEGELHWLPMAAIANVPLVEDLVWLLPRVLQLPADARPFFAHYRYDANDQLVMRAAN